MPTLFVTGGCGFIGSNFVRHLLETDPSRPHHQLRRARPTPATPPTSPTWRSNPRYRFVKGDITDRDGRAQACSAGRRRDHQLRRREPRRSQHPRQRAVRPHQRPRHAGPARRRPRARRSRGSCRSRPTRCTAASGRPGCSPKTTPLAPNSPYSASKAAADLLVRSYHHTFGMDAVITRCSNNYGPYQFPEKLIPLFITNLMSDQPVPVYGDGMQVRDWIHVRDHCARDGAAWRQGKAGRGLQLRRPLRDAQPAPDAQAAGTARQAEVADQLRPGPARATTGATPSTAPRSSANWAGRRR